MKEVTGDLLKMGKEGEFDVIIHGCNCYHTMGAGIARQIHVQFPDAYDADLTTAKGPAKLGCFSHVTVPCLLEGLAYVSTPELGEHLSYRTHPLTIINAYTQHRPGRDLKEWAMATALLRVAQSYPTDRIAMPLIGCGIAGGNWNDLKKMVEVIFKDKDLTVVHFG